VSVTKRGRSYRLHRESHHARRNALLTLPFCEALVVRVPGYRSIGPGSIPGPTKFSEKQWVWNRVHSASWVQLRSYLEEKNSGSGLENLDYGRRDPSRWPRGTLYPQKLALTSPTSGGLSVGILRSRTQATEYRPAPILLEKSMFESLVKIIDSSWK
jgi:hypothetical protein